jgi:tRNA synthetases class II core domain (F)
VPVGGLHPILLVERQMREIVHSFGFEVFEGPEVETDEYNFENRARPFRAPPSLRLSVAPATLQVSSEEWSAAAHQLAAARWLPASPIGAGYSGDWRSLRWSSR